MVRCPRRPAGPVAVGPLMFPPKLHFYSQTGSQFPSGLSRASKSTATLFQDMTTAAPLHGASAQRHVCTAARCCQEVRLLLPCWAEACRPRWLPLLTPTLASMYSVQHWKLNQGLPNEPHPSPLAANQKSIPQVARPHQVTLRELCLGQPKCKDTHPSFGAS